MTVAFGVRERARGLGRRSVLFDVLTAALTCGIGVIGLWLLLGPLADIYAKLGSPMTFSPTLAVLATLGMTVPLVLRRLFPVTTLAVVTAAYAVIGLARIPEYVSTSIALLVVVYTVGAYAPRYAHRSRALNLGVLAAITTYQLARADYSQVPGLDSTELALLSFYDRVSTVLVNVIAFAFAWVLGDTVRRSRQRQAELATRTAELAAANRTIGRQAVADERLRIARELHDVVAHHVSVMGLQAAAARRVLDRDQDAAVRSLRIVEDTGRRAVDELQRLLGMMRGERPDDGAPQPTMGDLVGLVERMRQTGMDVRVRTTGTAPELPAGVELSVYRVVQEALTNALKHAGSNARVDVELVYRAEELALAVRSRAAPGSVRRPAGRNGNSGGGNGSGSGSGSGSGDAGGGDGEPAVGRGLIGMRERIVMHGGRLHTEGLRDGGFDVLATIPV